MKGCGCLGCVCVCVEFGFGRVLGVRVRFIPNVPTSAGDATRKEKPTATNNQRNKIRRNTSPSFGKCQIPKVSNMFLPCLFEPQENKMKQSWPSRPGKVLVADLGEVFLAPPSQSLSFVSLLASLQAGVPLSSFFSMVFEGNIRSPVGPQAFPNEGPTQTKRKQPLRALKTRGRGKLTHQLADRLYHSLAPHIVPQAWLLCSEVGNGPTGVLRSPKIQPNPQKHTVPHRCPAPPRCSMPLTPKTHTGDHG